MVTNYPEFREALAVACLVLDWEVENSVRSAPQWAKEIREHLKTLAQLRDMLEPGEQPAQELSARAES